jgi:hypothetical protein
MKGKIEVDQFGADAASRLGGGAAKRAARDGFGDGRV